MLTFDLEYINSFTKRAGKVDAMSNFEEGRFLKQSLHIIKIM